MYHNRQQQYSANLRVLNSQDADSLLSNFPPTRLSYEASIHKNDTHQNSGIDYKCFILPKGRRCIAWATEWRRNKIFAVIEIEGGGGSRDDRDRATISPIIRKFHQDNGWMPGRVRILDACFDRSLVFGTVFGGVLFRTKQEQQQQQQCQFFSINSI